MVWLIGCKKHANNLKINKLKNLAPNIEQALTGNKKLQ